MAVTYEPIATVTVGSGGAASIDFTSIPGTYTDLQILLSSRGTNSSATEWVSLKFNASSTGYSSRWLEGNGSGAPGSFTGPTNRGYAGVHSAATATASTFGNFSIYIPNYASSNNKSYSSDTVSENNATAATAELGAGLWSNSAAITSITLTPDSANFAQYSTATLYGIKNS